MAATGPESGIAFGWYGKKGVRITWAEYKRRYLSEMNGQKERIAELAARSAQGETITLLCSSACKDPERCHRTLLKGLIEMREARSAKA